MRATGRPRPLWASGRALPTLEPVRAPAPCRVCQKAIAAGELAWMRRWDGGQSHEACGYWIAGDKRDDIDRRGVIVAKCRGCSIAIMLRPGRDPLSRWCRCMACRAIARRVGGAA